MTSNSDIEKAYAELQQLLSLQTDFAILGAYVRLQLMQYKYVVLLNGFLHIWRDEDQVFIRFVNLCDINTMINVPYDESLPLCFDTTKGAKNINSEISVHDALKMVANSVYLYPIATEFNVYAFNVTNEYLLSILPPKLPHDIVPIISSYTI